MTGFAIWLALTGSAWASKADGIQKLLDQERIETAQQRCERVGGTLSTAPSDLREVCARAFWYRTASEDTVAAWMRYRQVWADTSLAAPAREQEARVALTALGDDADAARIGVYVKTYGDTAYAAEGMAKLADAAVRAAMEDPERAREAARRYPDHPEVPRLVARFPTHFAKVTVREEAVSVTLDPPVELSSPPKAQWVAAFPGDQYVEWEQAAVAHLLELGLPRHWIDATRRSGDLPFVPCPIPGAPWELGVLLQVGESKTFLPQDGPSACQAYWPTFVVVQDGRVAAVALDPHTLLELGTPGADPYQARADGTFTWHLGRPAVPLLREDTLVQSVGGSFLFTPLTGGLPWLESLTHASGTLTLSPATLGTVQLPDGWRLTSGGRPLKPGAVSSAPVQVHADGLPGLSWTLPPGEIRVLSPLVTHHTGLHRKRDTPQAPAIRLPPAGQPLAAQPLDRADLRSTGFRLSGDQIPIEPTHAWRVDLKGDGDPQIVFEGQIAGQPVRGVLDPSPTRGGWRVHAWRHDGPQGQLAAVQSGGQRFALWKGADGRAEVVWFDARGLRREVR